jgi:hypothetical protein
MVLCCIFLILFLVKKRKLTNRFCIVLCMLYSGLVLVISTPSLVINLPDVDYSIKKLASPKGTALVKTCQIC